MPERGKGAPGGNPESACLAELADHGRPAARAAVAAAGHEPAGRVMLPGHAVRLKSEVFEAAVHASLKVSRCIHQYLHSLFIDLALSVSCNRLHSLQQRCARWILTSVDKNGLSEIAVTQEMLADILGVHRQSIIQVLNEFEAKRLVQCERGSIQIKSTQGLAALVCECYHIGRKRLEYIHGS